MSNAMSYRQATQDDLDILLAWTLRLMEHERVEESLELPLKQDVSEQVSTWLSNLIENDNALIIIADDQGGKPLGGILGLVQLAANDFVDITVYGLIQMVWVDKDYRGQGIASSLVTYMEDTFKSLNIPYCEIQYSASNNEAKAFWVKTGYSTVSHTCRKFLNIQ
jgi:ribosomal protein S18 acetylase RimI-like enzyme